LGGLLLQRAQEGPEGLLCLGVLRLGSGQRGHVDPITTSRGEDEILPAHDDGHHFHNRIGVCLHIGEGCVRTRTPGDRGGGSDLKRAISHPVTGSFHGQVLLDDGQGVLVFRHGSALQRQARGALGAEQVRSLEQSGGIDGQEQPAGRVAPGVSCG